MSARKISVREDTAHAVQLFDGEDTRARAVASFVQDGLSAGDTLLLVLTADHWKAVAARLPEVARAAATQSGQLVVSDAVRTLRQFIHRGDPEPRRFTASVGALIRELVSRGRPLRVYGEMVDLLAVRGEFTAALQLEALWNELAERHAFTLLCGYSAVSFGDPRTAAALREVCGAHTHVHSASDDVLGSFLLTTYGAQSAHS